MGHSVSFGNLKFDELIAAAFGKLAGELPSGATPGDVIVYTTNPFISKSATPVFKRAADRLNRTTKGFSSGMSYDDLAELDLLLEDSFNLITDEGGLEAALQDAKWQRTDAGQKKKIRRGGFLDLDKRLVEGMGQRPDQPAAQPTRTS